MRGVVSLLDEENSTFVRELWKELADEFGPGGLDADSSPHISFHVAETYDLEQTEARLVSLSRSLPPLETATNGVGLFLGEEQVVYLPVVRVPRLHVMQRAVFDEVRRHATGEHEAYRPDRWIPHVTLGTWPAADGIAAKAVASLVERGVSLSRTLPIDNLSIIEEGAETHRSICSVKLTP